MANDLSVKLEAPSLTLQPILAEEVRRAPQEERACAATASYSPQRAAERRQGESDIRGHSPAGPGSRNPGDSGVGAGPFPRPSGSTHSASGQQESHSPRPPPSVPPGEGVGGRFRAPLFSPSGRIPHTAVKSIHSGLACPPGHPPPAPTPLPHPQPGPRDRTDWPALTAPGKETPGDWP